MKILNGMSAVQNVKTGMTSLMKHYYQFLLESNLRPEIKPELISAFSYFIAECDLDMLIHLYQFCKDTCTSSVAIQLNEILGNWVEER